MAPTCAKLSIREFLPGLNWRPLHFVDPLPSSGMCKVCGVLGKETVVLPCSHAVCNVCFEGSVALGCVCPLGGEVFDRDAVDRLCLRPGQVLILNVSCWNSAHGCDFVGPVFELLDHFEKDCIYHGASCPRCLQEVPRVSLVQHYVNDCSPTKSAKEPRADVTHKEAPSSEDLGKTGAEIIRAIADLKDGYHVLQASVNTIVDEIKLGRSEASQALTEALSNRLPHIHMTQQDYVKHSEVQLFEYLVKVIADLKDGYHVLQESVNTMVDEVKLGHSEASQAITEALSNRLPHVHMTQSDDVKHGEEQLLEYLVKASAEFKRSVAEFKASADIKEHIAELKESAQMKQPTTKIKDGYQKLQASIKAVVEKVKRVLPEPRVEGKRHIVIGGFLLALALVSVLVAVRMGAFGVDFTSVPDMKPVIKDSAMPETMQQEAVRLTTEAVNRYRKGSDIAFYILDKFDRKYWRNWQCIVGYKLVHQLRPANNYYIHFNLDQMDILLLRPL